MAIRATTVAFLLVVVLVAGAGASGTPLGWIPSLAGCRGTIAECLAAGEELDLGTEVSRRMLATSSYISYGALNPDTTPCSVSGASYYNCRPGAQANPYSRSCSAINQCRG
ncbi:rapid alkalinization factor-like [Curcuma longa]|uniref:rapid alkalinization factor-like n=1 Tax=Curcuma longa TaxID=136217 RepID=UPI003D9E72E2